MKTNNLLFIFIFFIYGCSHSVNQNSNDSEAVILNFYYNYIDTVENSKLEKEYKKYYSEMLSTGIEKEISPVTNRGLGWHIMSSYMPKKFIKKYYIDDKFSDGTSACMTLIGKSFDGNPMFVNLSLIKEQHQWKINNITRKAFIDGVTPSFPDKATCSEQN